MNNVINKKHFHFLDNKTEFNSGFLRQNTSNFEPQHDIFD